ncbi:MAG: hypothetical protein LBH38_01645 [Holosporales bacterium]|nr:hypothetical protein [Holosporales bacterium]
MIRKSIALIFFLFFNDSHATEVAHAHLDKYDGIFEIRSQGHVVGNFKVSIKNDGKVAKEGEESIAFTIQLEDIRLSTDITGVNKLKCSHEGGADQEINLLSKDGKYRTEDIHIPLAKSFYSQKRNGEFSVTLTFQLRGVPIVFDKVDIIIVPEINIAADRDTVDFGTLFYDNNRVYGPNREVILYYKILNNGKCFISSRNGFCLKHPNGDLIEYAIGKGELAFINQNITMLTLDAHGTTYRLELNVDSYSRDIPSSGNYQDSLTISFLPNE